MGKIGKCSSLGIVFKFKAHGWRQGVQRCINRQEGAWCSHCDQEHLRTPAGTWLSTQGAAMEKSYVSVFLLLVAISCVLAKDIGKKETKETSTKPKLPQTLSRGWGDQLIWTQTYEEALFRAKNSNKPLMIIHHLDDCPHSQALKKVFAEHKEIQKLAEKFILLNLVYETTDKNLAPDGQYVPRILFIDPSLTVRADITGRYSNRLYAYEPSDISLLYSNMQKALKLLKTEL